MQKRHDLHLPLPWTFIKDALGPGSVLGAESSGNAVHQVLGAGGGVGSTEMRNVSMSLLPI